jgi:hypothetical protein
MESYEKRPERDVIGINDLGKSEKHRVKFVLENIKPIVGDDLEKVTHLQNLIIYNLVVPRHEEDLELLNLLEQILEFLRDIRKGRTIPSNDISARELEVKLKTFFDNNVNKPIT